MCSINSRIIFDNYARAYFNKNLAEEQGGAIYSTHSFITIAPTGKVELKFFSNHALFGGTVYSDSNSNIVVDGSSTATFISNSATIGGAIYSHYSIILFTGAFKVYFINSTVTKCGGAVFSSTNSNVMFKGATTVSFINNTGLQNVSETQMFT